MGQSFSATSIDYEVVIPFKHRLLETAWTSFRAGARADLQPAYEQFCSEQAHWLDDYSLFRALKARSGGAIISSGRRSWSGAIRLPWRRPDWTWPDRSIRFASHNSLFRQGARLKEHARARGLSLIGDLPFFVSPDSSDVWANPESFLLDEQHRPRFVAGVPPDYFSSQGQLWGNPVYDWKALRGPVIAGASIAY